MQAGARQSHCGTGQRPGACARRGRKAWRWLWSTRAEVGTETPRPPLAALPWVSGGEARAAPGCPQPRPGLSSGAAVGRQVATLHFISWDCKKKQAKPPRLAKGQRWQLLPAALLCEAGCSAGSAQGRVWVRRRWGPADPAQLPQHLPSSCVPMAPCLCATLTLVVPVFS